MKAIDTLVLDAAPKNDALSAQVFGIFKDCIKKSGSRLLVQRPGEMKIHHCTGCFTCWIKTPGLCIFDDDGRKVAHAMSRARRIVVFTPLVYGIYSDEIKNAIERSISILLPTFRKWKGEMHHPARYDTSPELVGVGFADRTDDGAPELFRRHLMRNALNFNSVSLVSTVFKSGEARTDEDVAAQLDSALANPGEITP